MTHALRHASRFRTYYFVGFYLRQHYSAPANPWRHEHGKLSWFEIAGIGTAPYWEHIRSATVAVAWLVPVDLDTNKVERRLDVDGDDPHARVVWMFVLFEVDR